MAIQTLMSTKKDLVDLGIRQIELALGFAADERQTNATFLGDRPQYLFFNTLEDYVLYGSPLSRCPSLQITVKRVRDINGGSHRDILPYLWLISSPDVQTGLRMPGLS